MEPPGVPLPSLILVSYPYAYFVIGVFSMLIVTTFFAFLGFVRLFLRKTRRIESQTHYFIKHSRFDRYYMFLVLAFLLVSAIALIVYWINWPALSYFLIICLIPLYGLLYANAYLHYILNDYNILQNIDALNAKIGKHNERLVELKAKV
jgi:phosphate/sulfate permease